MKVVLDTNALLLPATCKIDIFSETERLVEGKPEFIAFAESFSELKAKSRKMALWSEAIRRGIEKEGGKILQGGGKVDEMVLAYAQKNRGNVAVLTEDRELMEKLRGIGQVQLIFSKKKDHLSTDWKRSW